MWLSLWIALICVAFAGFSLMLLLVGFGAFRELREMLTELRTHRPSEKD